METLIIVLIVLFIAYEFIEHVAFPLFGSLARRKNISTFGPERILGEKGEVKEWQGNEGYVFVNGELWKGVSEVSLKIGDRVVIKKIRGLTVTVKLLNPKEDIHQI